MFKRIKKQQEHKFARLKKEVDKNFVFTMPSGKSIWSQNVTLSNKQEDTFTINSGDLDKLAPNTDLNDTIVGVYLKFIQTWMLSEKMA